MDPDYSVHTWDLIAIWVVLMSVLTHFVPYGDRTWSWVREVIPGSPVDLASYGTKIITI
jgi:hypothetical protein